MAKKRTTLEVDIQVLEDLSYAIQSLFELLISKPLYEADTEKILYISKLMNTVNENLKNLNNEL
jgi:adenylyl- and sulfurtransferase ThiI